MRINRIVAIVLLILGLVMVELAHAQTETRFDWKFYNRAPVLTLKDNDDLTVVRVLTGEEGENNQKLMQAAICLVFYATESCDKRVLDQVVTSLREGKWEWKTYEQNSRDLVYPLSHGVMVKGERKVAVTKFAPIIHTHDENNKPVNPRARILYPMLLPGKGELVSVVIFEKCYNVSGQDGLRLLLASQPPTPPPAIQRVPPPPPPAVQQVPPPPPAIPEIPVVPQLKAQPTEQKQREKKVETKELLYSAVAVDVGGLKSWSHTTYDCVTKNCDAEQWHETQALVIGGEVQVGAVVARGKTSLAEKNTRIRYDDPLPKRRDLEHGHDKFWNIEAGWEHMLSDELSVQFSGRVDSYRNYDDYFAPRSTSIELRYVTYGGAVSVSRFGDVRLRVTGLIEPFGRRDKTGQQEGYPDAHDDRQTASLYGVEGEVELRLANHIGVFGSGSWTRRSSFRPGPASNPGDEFPHTAQVIVGVRFHLK